MLQAFRFPLETLLRFRQQQEEQAQLCLAAATNELLQEKEMLFALEQEFVSILDVLRQRQNDRVTVAELKMLRDYNDKLKEEINEQQIRVDNAAAKQQECLLAVVQAMKARKIVEKLREKRALQYQIEMLSEEQKNLDELGLQVYIRNS